MVAKRRNVAKPRDLDEQARGQRQQSRASEPAAATTSQQAQLSHSARRDPPVENACTAENTADGSLNKKNALELLIEEERVHLMQVFGILRCLYDVLLYADDDDSTMHADVAHVCATLIDECVARLEVIVKRYKAGEFRESSRAQTPSEDLEQAPVSLNRSDEGAEDE